MRLGIDLDGCAYSFNEAWRIAHCLRTGLNINEFDPPVTQWSFFEQEEWGNLSLRDFVATCVWGVDRGIIFSVGAPILGFADAMRSLHRDGHELHIVTARTFPGVEEQCQIATKAWLHSFGVPYDSLTFSEDKTEVPTDIYIDDRDKNLEALDLAGTVPVRMVQPWNTHVEKYAAVRNWGEFCTFVWEMKNNG